MLSAFLLLLLKWRFQKRAVVLYCNMPDDTNVHNLNSIDNFFNGTAEASLQLLKPDPFIDLKSR